MSVANLNTPALRLHQILASFSTSIEESTSELVDFLTLILDSIASEPENEESEKTAFEVLLQILQYLRSPSLDQEVIDALSFDLPKAVTGFACASKRCMDVAESVINRFIETCSPRDMLSILCEALGSQHNNFKASAYYALILSGLAKVFLSIERRHFEQIKAAVPGILNVLKEASSEPDEEDAGVEDLFYKSIGITNSIQAVCVNLEGKDNKKICALLGLTVLQIMALASINMGDKVSRCLPFVLQLSHLLRYCRLSYLGLITECDVDAITSIAIEGTDDEDDYVSCFSYVKHGAALSVIWCHMSNEVAVVAEADFVAAKVELQSTQTKRWEVVGMLKYIFSCVNLPWQLKKHAIDFLHFILEGHGPNNCHSDYLDYSLYMPSLYAALQALQVIIMYASDTVFRKKAFATFKLVLEDIPAALRFDILVALVKNSESSSMIAILLDCLREEMHKEKCHSVSDGNGVLEASNRASEHTLLWSAKVLELVEFVLRPPKGGPPTLPGNSDAVLSTLNLYRYVLITESTGKTNYTGVLFKNNLQKAYKEWFLPLRALVTGIVAQNQDDYDQLTFDLVCALNPVELVLYHCIELVEENMKQST